MAAEDTFKIQRPDLASPCDNAAAVTPSDANDLTVVTRGLFVGGAGNVEVITHGGQTVIFTGVVAGSILPIRVTRVKAASTTATNIMALW
jgi:hypothetical protein